MQTEPKNDSDLLRLLKQGDEEAYLQLYDRYHSGLYAWLLGFVKIPEFAQDIVQEAFLKIWEIRARLNPDQSFPAFLYKISRNRAIKLLKKAADDEKLRVRIRTYLQQSAEDPALQLQWQQYQELLHKAIASLPSQRQKVFRLCRQEGKSYEEAAQELGISKNTVKEHMVAAVKDIKKYIYNIDDLPVIMLLLLITL